MSRESEFVNSALTSMYVHHTLYPTKNGRKYDWAILKDMSDEYNRLIKNARVYSVPRGMSRGFMTKNIFFDDPIAAYGRLFTIGQPEFPLILTSTPSFVKYVKDVKPTGFVYLDLVNDLLLNTEIHNMIKKYIRENPYETSPMICSGRFCVDSVTNMRSMVTTWNENEAPAIKTVTQKKMKKKGKQKNGKHNVV